MNQLIIYNRLIEVYLEVLRNKSFFFLDKMHHYFARKPSEWSIEGFLKNCEEQKTARAKIGLYITCLNKIVNDENEEIPRREKARKLLNNYQTVILRSFLLIV